MRDLGIDRIMTEHPTTIGPDASVADAREALRLNGVHHLPVVQDGKLVGLVSASDVLNWMLVETNSSVLASIPVQRFMEKHPVVLTPDATLREAADQLNSGAFHSLPVITQDRVLIGIVTSTDLIQHLLQRLPTGDGSTVASDRADSAGADLDAAITNIERAAAAGTLPEEVATQVRGLQQRNTALETVVDAAQRYIRSGLADHEHTQLVRSLAKLRDVETPLGL